MKFSKVLCTFLLLSSAPVVAQEECFWAQASNRTNDAAAASYDNQNQDVRVSTCYSGVWSDPEIIPGSEYSYPWPLLIDKVYKQANSLQEPRLGLRPRPAPNKAINFIYLKKDHSHEENYNSI